MQWLITSAWSSLESMNIEKPGSYSGFLYWKYHGPFSAKKVIGSYATLARLFHLFGNNRIMIKQLYPYVFMALLCILFSGCNDDDSNFNQNTIGQWSIMAINLSDSPLGPVETPEDGEMISITFQPDGNFSGNTSVNTFGGKSTTNGMNLFINELVTTEVADTPFGQAFYQAIYRSSGQNEGPSEFEIIVVNDNIINLVFNEFRFLSLERL